MTLITVCCTGMIYASLRPIRQWHNALTMPTYVALGLMTGAILLVPLSAAFGLARPTFATLALVLTVVGWLMKRAYWRHIDATPPSSTLATATGLARFGEVRLLEMPHTEENFIMREMGFQVARKHAARLRGLATLFLFAAHNARLKGVRPLVEAMRLLRARQARVRLALIGSEHRIRNIAQDIVSHFEAR